MTLGDQELDRRLNALVNESPPDDVIWERIESKLDRRRPWPWTIAAAVIVALGVAFVAWPQGDWSLESGPQVVQIEPASELTGTRALATVPRLARNSSLLAAWQANQTAINDIEQALNDSPNNPLLQQFLGKARLREAQLIQLDQFLPERSIES